MGRTRRVTWTRWKPSERAGTLGTKIVTQLRTFDAQLENARKLDDVIAHLHEEEEAARSAGDFRGVTQIRLKRAKIERTQRELRSQRARGIYEEKVHPFLIALDHAGLMEEQPIEVQQLYTHLKSTASSEQQIVAQEQAEKIMDRLRDRYRKKGASEASGSASSSTETLAPTLTKKDGEHWSDTFEQNFRTMFPSASRRTTERPKLAQTFLRHQKGALLAEYEMHMNPPPDRVTHLPDAICPTCGIPMILQPRESDMVCPNPQCGRTQRYLTNNLSTMAYGDDIEIQANDYDRLNHLREVIVQVQGEQTSIDPAYIERTLHQLKAYFRSKFWLDKDMIVPQRIRMAMRAMGITDFQHAVFFCNLMRGEPGLRFTEEQKRILIDTFKIVEPAYEKLKDPMLSGRVSFLGYLFFIYKVAEIHGWREWCDFIQSIDEHSVHYARYDDIWRAICELTHIDFHRTILENVVLYT